MYILLNLMVDENDYELKGFLENGFCIFIVLFNNNFFFLLMFELFC